jgi:hypothetical protein
MRPAHRLTLLAAVCVVAAGIAIAAPSAPNTAEVNPIPATPYGPLPASATEPPSGKAVAVEPTTIAVPAAPAKTVKAGVAVVDATWKVGASAGQYAGNRVLDAEDFASVDPEDPHVLSILRVPSYGIESRLSVRALVVEGTDGSRIALATNDLYIPQDLLNQRVSTILKEHDRNVTLGLADGPPVRVTDANLAISVSHSHTSPYYSAAAWGVWAFQDVFDIRYFEYMAQRHAQAVILAANNLKPVRMGAVEVPFDYTQRHSFGPQTGDDGTPAGYPQRENDLSISVIRFDDISDRADPKPLATYFTLGQHPEMLEGNNLISGEWVQDALRMVDMATGGTTLHAQNNTGTSEPDRNGEAHAPEVRAEFSHREYAQAERAARQVANAVLRGFNAVGTGAPPIPDAYVPYSIDFPVMADDRQFAPPVSHPLPTVSNCRTDAAFNGQPGIPIIGLPDCDRTAGDFVGPVFGELQGTPLDPGVTFERLKAAGIPIPENYSAPSYAALQETIQVHLQAFRLGDVLLTMCPCEQWADQGRNIKSRADTVAGNIWLGWDWTEFCHQNGGAGSDWTCPNPRAVDTWEEDPSDPPADGTLTVSDALIKKIHAQVTNDAAGWDDVANLLAAETEPADPTKIWGNYTHTELPAEIGYQLVMPVGMTNDYFGYIATYREYQRGDAYRKALTGLGPHSSDWLATRLVAMGGAMKGHQPSIDKVAYSPVDLAYMVDGLHEELRATVIGTAARAYVPLYEATLPADGGGAPAILKQPGAITRFDVAQVTWRGGNNFDEDLDVVVERETAPGQWTRAGDMTGDVVVTVDFPDDLVTTLSAATIGQYEWRWTAHFEAFNSDIDTAHGNQTPAGTYRFVMRGKQRSGTPAQPHPYQLVSQPFTVSPWDGITIDDLRVEPGGGASFLVGPRTVKEFSTFGYPDVGRLLTLEVGPIDYPDSWAKAKLPTEAETGIRIFPRLDRHVIDNTQRYCFSCTFRPWADTGQVASATATITRADGRVDQVTAALGTDGRWHIPAGALRAGDSVAIAAGGVVDTFGERNGQASPSVTADAGAIDGQLPATGGSAPAWPGAALVAVALALVLGRKLGAAIRTISG